MTDEAKALVDAKLYGMGVLKNGKHVPLEDVYLDPRDALIETQAREIERLREALRDAIGEIETGAPLTGSDILSAALAGDSHD